MCVRNGIRVCLGRCPTSVLAYLKSSMEEGEAHQISTACPFFLCVAATPELASEVSQDHAQLLRCLFLASHRSLWAAWLRPPPLPPPPLGRALHVPVITPVLGWHVSSSVSPLHTVVWAPCKDTQTCKQVCVVGWWCWTISVTAATPGCGPRDRCCRAPPKWVSAEGLGIPGLQSC